MDSKVVRADFGSGLICPRAQTCCASPTQTPARLANSPGFKSFRCPRERIKFSLERYSNQSAAHVGESNSRSNVVQIRRASACVLSRWKVLSGEFRRRPTALARNFANRIVSVAEDCLSPERTFHGCSLMHFRICFRS